MSMGVPVSTVFDIIEKIKAWVVRRVDDSQDQWDSDIGYTMCCECKTQFMDSNIKSDGRGNSNQGEEPVKLCRYCEHNRKFDRSASGKLGNDNVKLFQSDHLLRFLEANRLVTNSSVASSADDLSPVSFTRSSSRSDEEEDVEDSGKHFLRLSNEYYRDASDMDSCSVSGRHEFFSAKSVGSSPFDSPSRITATPRSGSSVQLEQEGSPVSFNDASLRQERLANLRGPGTECDDIETTGYGSDDSSVFRDQHAEVKQPFDFESNGLIWLPPPPDDAEDEIESNFFKYDDDDDDDDDVGESGLVFKKSNISTDIFRTKGKSNEEHKEPLRAVVHGHFRALVLQLLLGEDILVENEDRDQGWLSIVTSLAWQAANFVKPDTRSGGSMDPGNYVKIKCIESGSPSESTLIKGVVCTKNIKHKRMTSQYRNPRIFLLGGALEYQRASNQLASFDALLQQEIDHLKLIVSKIEAHRPNVLLVEKSVSSYAQEYLLAKDISLVLNVKRSLLERVARCTGAHIVPSVDKISSARLGNCEVFRLERIVEECSVAHQPNKKSTKTLMFFEGCPRRLGCTVLLRGAHSELLKKVKRVMHYAVFAAYHLSLETSFLADEGATLLKTPLVSPISFPERLMNTDGDKSLNSNSVHDGFLAVEGQSEDMCECSMSVTSCFDAILDVSVSNDRTPRFTTDDNYETSCLDDNTDCVPPLHAGSLESRHEADYHHQSNRVVVSNVAQDVGHESFARISSNHELTERSVLEEESIVRHQWESTYSNDVTRSEEIEANGVFSEYLAGDNHPSILVSFSSHCVLKGTLCERSQLLRIKFYSSFDKPLGRYLQDDLFDQTAYCRSCKQSTDAHVRCYIHQQGSLSINVRRLLKVDLPGKHEGKIWMWHRCLKCARIDGIPPANRRVLMSDAAWGLSFGKFLELSFSNHATANRVASCGHSLQRDCLRFYGYGSMVAFFRYSPIDILSVCLPPSMLEFDGRVQQGWVKKEAIKLYNEMGVLYAEVLDSLHSIEERTSTLDAYLDESGFHNHITDLKALLKKERNEYETMLHPVYTEDPQYWDVTLDILELNRLRRCLLMDSYIWDHRLYSLESLSKNKALAQMIDPHLMDVGTYDELKQWRDDLFFKNTKLDGTPEEKRISWTISDNPEIYLLPEEKEEHCFSIMNSISDELTEKLIMKSVENYCGNSTKLATDSHDGHCDSNIDHEVSVNERSLESIPSPASYLSDKIDSVWTGTAREPIKAQNMYISPSENRQTGTVGVIDLLDNRSFGMLKSPMRVHSFDSAMTIQEKIRRGLSPSLQLSSLRSFHASGEFSSMVRDPVPHILRTLSQKSSREAQKLSFIFNSKPLFISSASNLAGEGVRLLLPQTGHKNIVVPVCDNEPTSVVSYALCSKEYENWITDKLVDHRVSNASESNGEDQLNISGFYSDTSTFSAFHSFASLESEDIFFRSHLSNDSSSTIGSMFSDQKKSPHFSISFEDEYSSSPGKVKFSVICYFGRQFDTLRKMCCPNEIDFIRSLSRCSRWNAQGGKSNVYFAKSLDERFIVKQVTKTELDSFEEFAPQYFKYLMDSLSTGSPTCLAKVFGIYQVTIKHPKSGKQTKMDLMVMENLFFKRNISRVYDLKGSARARYNADTTGKDKVLLDMNLLETLRTQPIFLGSKAKRILERAVWNDTFFLASIDVMDYSLLVGVDDEGKELVLGIIDFMRQYTWDKHLETWVKASGILGGPKNISPTVVSPMQYKKRFRKAMTTYFLTVPDQWSL